MSKKRRIALLALLAMLAHITGPPVPVLAQPHPALPLGNSAPTLDMGDVEPDEGDASTVFRFSVEYTDPDGDPPSMSRVVIDDQAHTMEFWYEYDGTGQLWYKYDTLLPCGTFEYYFYFEDGQGGSARDPSSGIYDGSVICGVDPVLSAGSVAPPAGDESTLFTYQVKYTDADGDWPGWIVVGLNSSPEPMTLNSGSDPTVGLWYIYQGSHNCGPHDYYFEANDGHGRSDRLPLTGSYSGPTVECAPSLPDLSIDSVVPIQVLEGQDLVLDKSTAVKMVLRKTGSDALGSVQLKVTYNGNDYTTFYVSEPGNRDSDFVLQQDDDAYPLAFASDEITKTVYFFDGGLTPTSPGDYVVAAQVDPDNLVSEADEENNSYQSDAIPVYSTRWSGLLLPELSVQYFRADWGATPDSLFGGHVEGSRQLVEGSWPVSEEGFDAASSDYEADSSLFRNSDDRLDDIPLNAWLKWLSVRLRLAAPKADNFIGVVPPDWFFDHTVSHWIAVGYANRNISSVVLAQVRTDDGIDDTARYVTAVHELGHAHGLRLDCEEYYWQDADCPQKKEDHSAPDRTGETVANGLWVEERRLMEHSAQHPVYCFMGAASDPRYWIDGDCYSNLLADHTGGLLGADLAQASTGDGILVAGTAFLTGTVELDDWYVLPEAQIDDIPPGDYSLAYLDEADLLLYEHPFGISFTVEGISSTVAPFAFTAPYVPGTARVVVRHGTTDLAEKMVSSSVPTVSVLSPNGGETLLTQSAIEWSASDDDGDPLSYAVLFSPDGGDEWNTLATDVATTSYEWDLRGLPPSPSYLVKVIATDGFNTGYDASNGPFTVQGQTFIPLVMNEG